MPTTSGPPWSGSNVNISAGFSTAAMEIRKRRLVASIWAYPRFIGNSKIRVRESGLGDRSGSRPGSILVEHVVDLALKCGHQNFIGVIAEAFRDQFIAKSFEDIATNLFGFLAVNQSSAHLKPCSPPGHFDQRWIGPLNHGRTFHASHGIAPEEGESDLSVYN
jgi:hypothetical protein